MFLEAPISTDNENARCKFLISIIALSAISDATSNAENVLIFIFCI